MWLLFVLACLIAVILQIVDRVQYFYSWPLNVNVKINYNQTLDFPAVTICNQNAFRYIMSIHIDMNMGMDPKALFIKSV